MRPRGRQVGDGNDFAPTTTTTEGSFQIRGEEGLGNSLFLSQHHIDVQPTKHISESLNHEFGSTPAGSGTCGALLVCKTGVAASNSG